MHRLAVALALVGGIGGALLLVRTQADPCGALLRKYAAAYEAQKPCASDAECALDPMPPGGPGVCDRARRASDGREALERIEQAWSSGGCPRPGPSSCPEAGGARCERGRCVTALKQ